MKFHSAVKQAIDFGYTHLKAADGTLTPLSEIGKVTPAGTPANHWVFYHASYSEPRIANQQASGYYELEPKPEPCAHPAEKQKHYEGNGTFCDECGEKLNP